MKNSTYTLTNSRGHHGIPMDVGQCAGIRTSTIGDQQVAMALAAMKQIADERNRYGASYPSYQEFLVLAGLV